MASRLGSNPSCVSLLVVRHVHWLRFSLLKKWFLEHENRFLWRFLLFVENVATKKHKVGWVRLVYFLAFDVLSVHLSSGTLLKPTPVHFHANTLARLARFWLYMASRAVWSGV